MNKKSTSQPERLQKFLARFGVASRRKIEEMINAGEITVDGKVAELGCKVTEHSKIVIAGKKFTLNTRASDREGINPGEIDTKLIMYHKPIGEICSKDDPQGRPTVYDYLPKLRNSRWISIGRLDINTCGLLLFTNNGDLANKMMHPSNNVEREYLVRILGEVPDAILKKLLTGVQLEDGSAKFKSIATLKKTNASANNWFKVVLMEGRKREVRRLWEAVDCKVNRLIRIRYGNYSLPRDLPPGRYMELAVDEDLM